MITLKNLNVVKVADSEEKALIWESKGFKRVVPADDTNDDPNLPIEDMTVPQLKAYAKLHDIDITGKTAKPEILAAIQAAEGGGNDGNDQTQGQTV